MKHIYFLFLVLFFSLYGFGQVATEVLPPVVQKVSYPKVMAAPANDNCASATSLTPGASLLCGQTTDQATLQGGECYTNYGGGSTETTVWYRFTATNDSLVLNLIKTNYTNCSGPHIKVFGPVAPGGGCLPACATAIYDVLQNGDPGSHILLTGLQTTGNNQYLIQVQSNDCGGPSDGFTNFCINVINPATNAYSSGATLINACGTAFAGTSNGGYWQNGTTTGFNNLDNNAGTTCSGCTAGDDTPFIINNVSWFSFCSATAGTWQITINGISGCTLPAPNQGVQASVFTGTTTALVNQGNSTNPISPGGSWTSAVITVNAGSCAWLMIDGFAGDACNYNVTLTNVSGGCIVLPVELKEFLASIDGTAVELKWTTLKEKNNDYFLIEKSIDGVNYTTLGNIKGAGNSHNKRDYVYYDEQPFNGVNYYRLTQVDINGEMTTYSYAVINYSRLQSEPVVSYDGNNNVVLSNLSNKAEINIYNIQGGLMEKKVYFSQGDNSLKLDISELQCGMYILTIYDGDKTVSKKIAKN